MTIKECTFKLPALLSFVYLPMHTHIHTHTHTHTHTHKHIDLEQAQVMRFNVIIAMRDEKDSTDTF